MLSQAEGYSFIFPSTFFLKVNGCLLLLFVFYSVSMADLFPKLHLVLLFLTGRCLGTLLPLGHGECVTSWPQACFSWIPCCPSGHISGRQVSWASVQGIQSLPLCVWSVYSTCTLGWLLKLVFLSEFWICLLSVNFQRPVGKLILIFCDLLVLFLPSRSPSGSSLSLVPWGLMVCSEGSLRVWCWCLVVPCDLAAL